MRQGPMLPRYVKGEPADPTNCRVTPMRWARDNAADEKSGKARSVDALLKITSSRPAFILNGQRPDPAPSAGSEWFSQPALVPRQSSTFAAHRRARDPILGEHASHVHWITYFAKCFGANTPESVPAARLIPPTLDGSRIRRCRTMAKEPIRRRMPGTRTPRGPGRCDRPDKPRSGRDRRSSRRTGDVIRIESPRTRRRACSRRRSVRRVSRI